MKGRKPIPTNIKRQRGNPGRRPINENEPEFERILLEPPPELSPEAREEWERVAPGMYQRGMITLMDRAALFSYCQQWARMIQAERAIQTLQTKGAHNGLLIKTDKGNLLQHPLVGIANRAHELMLKGATEFGMTPSSRTRVNVPTDGKSENRFKANGVEAKEDPPV